MVEEFTPFVSVINRKIYQSIKLKKLPVMFVYIFSK